MFIDSTNTDFENGRNINKLNRTDKLFGEGNIRSYGQLRVFGAWDENQYERPQNFQFVISYDGLVGVFRKINPTAEIWISKKNVIK